MQSKEQVYDEQIAGLMAQVLSICKERKIAMVASFALDGDLLCTSLLADDDYEPPSNIIRAYQAIMGNDRPDSILAMTITAAE